MTAGDIKESMYWVLDSEDYKEEANAFYNYTL
jgi:hypothetical protein